MLRVLATIILPLLAPTGLYLLGLAALHRLGRVRWRTLPWVWLAGAGAALLAIVLFVVDVHFGAPQQGVYVPPQWHDGHIIPAHIAPQPGPTRGSSPRAKGPPARAPIGSLGGSSWARGDPDR